MSLQTFISSWLAGESPVAASSTSCPSAKISFSRSLYISLVIWSFSINRAIVARSPSRIATRPPVRTVDGACSRNIRSRDTVIISLLRILSCRATIICSVCSRSNCCAYVRRISGVFSLAPCSMSFCFSAAKPRTFACMRLRSLSNSISWERSSAAFIVASVFRRVVSHSKKFM